MYCAANQPRTGRHFQLISPSDRDRALVREDLAQGYISEASARDVFGLSEDDIAYALEAGRLGRSVK